MPASISDAVAWMRARPFLWLAFVAGVAVRLDQILRQILVDDEWHALHVATRHDFVYLLTHFGVADHSIPLAAYDKLLLATIGLNELLVRLPMLACGIAAVLLAPALVARETGRAAQTGFAWLLALSPLHVYFSRFARPYAITMLLAFVALLAFWRWYTGGARRWAVLYVAASASSALLNLTCVPALFAPIAFAAVDRLVGRGERGRGLGQAIVVGASALLLAALLLAPALVIDHASLQGKSGLGRWTLDALLPDLRALLGVRPRWQLALAGLLAVTGALALWRRARAFLIYVLFASAGQLGAVLVARPALIELPNTMVRYVIVLLPVGLMLIACGLAAIEGLVLRDRWPRLDGLLACALAIAAFLQGSWSLLSDRPNAWTSFATFQPVPGATSPRVQKAASLVMLPEFYYQLARNSPGSKLVLEAPWFYDAQRNPFVFYQHLHRQEMMIGFVSRDGQPCRSGEMPVRPAPLEFRNFAHVSDLALLRRRGVDLVIFHKDLTAELAFYWRVLGTIDPAAEGVRPDRVPVDDWIALYRARCGAPVYEDSFLVVFGLRPAPAAR
jgi:hypothetical protein